MLGVVRRGGDLLAPFYFVFFLFPFRARFFFGGRGARFPPPVLVSYSFSQLCV